MALGKQALIYSFWSRRAKGWRQTLQMMDKLATSDLLVSQKQNGSWETCMPRNWHNRRRAVPPTDTVMQSSGNNVASYQAPGTEVPIRGTTRWAEFTSQSFALRLEWGHPGKNARKAEAKALVKVFFSPAHSSALHVAQNKGVRPEERAQKLSMRWPGHQKLSLSSSHPGWSSCS